MGVRRWQKGLAKSGQIQLHPEPEGTVQTEPSCGKAWRLPQDQAYGRPHLEVVDRDLRVVEAEDLLRQQKGRHHHCHWLEEDFPHHEQECRS